MEDDQRKQREMFDSDFEFGSLTPESPTRDPYKNSPADHLFYKGKMLPHSFPPQTSRTSSCKSSLMSSRSNSVNSCSSTGRTSSSSSSSTDNSETRLMYRTRKFGSVSSSSSSSSPMASKLVMAQLYGSSQRWQHIMPLPVLKRDDSRRSIGGVLAKNGICKEQEDKKKKNKSSSSSSSSSGFCLRFLKSLLVTCRECHSMEPSDSDDMLQHS